MFGRTDSFAQPDRNARRARRALARFALAGAVAALAVACGDDDPGPVLTIGAGDSAQSRVLAEIYAGALSRTGAHTATRSGIEQRGYLSALDSDTVSVLPEVSGDLLTALDSTATARKPDDVITALNRALPEGLIVSDPADGTDLRPAVVVPESAAAQFPSSLQDLAPRCAELTVGIATGPALEPLHAPLDPERDVLAPLRTVYNCALPAPRTYSTAADLRNALSTGEVQLAVLSGPPAYLPEGGLAVTPLADPDYAFRAANVLPLLRKAALTDQQLRKLNYVAGELTTTELADMIRQVRDNNVDPAGLARNWLDAHAL
ncbi:glycine betaine ABC transporter substrate-binding protein [Nocardia sp. NPDC127526]|uniref:glycine betaine ABC transporter substrate-binding protein n=1 Tax=Nocardia sp. NPDC127526 TaxID=3345393 RepID=UPI00362FAA42